MSAAHYLVDVTLEPGGYHCLKIGPAIVQIKHGDEAIFVDAWPDRENGDQDIALSVWLELNDFLDED